MMRRSALSIWTLLAFAFPGAAAAHQGMMDDYSCHPDKTAGNYHCHREPLAGRTFSSEAEMLRALPPDLKRRKPPREKISTLCSSSSAITTADIQTDQYYKEKSELDGKPVELCCRLARMSFDKDPFISYHCTDEWFRIPVRFAGPANFGDWDLVLVRGIYDRRRDDVTASGISVKRRDGRAFVERFRAANNIRIPSGKPRYLGDSRGGRYPSRDGRFSLSLPPGFRPFEFSEDAAFQWINTAEGNSFDLTPMRDVKSPEEWLREDRERWSDDPEVVRSPIEERSFANGVSVHYYWTASKGEDDPERMVDGFFMFYGTAYRLGGVASKKPYGLDRVLQILGTIRPGK